MKNQGATPFSPPSSPRFGAAEHQQRGSRNAAARRAALFALSPRTALACGSLDGDDRTRERGSIFVMIFVAIALFAGLSWALSQGMRSGSSQLTDQQAKLAASEILEYGNTVRSAVRNATINGCADTHISFENNVELDYTNPATTNNACKIFHPSGGGLSWKIHPSNFFYQPASAAAKYSSNVFNGDNHVENIGDNSLADLIILTPYLKKEICIEINKLLNIENPTGSPPINDSMGLSGIFTGTYRATKTAGATIGGKQTLPAGISEACFQESVGCTATLPLPNECYHYYKVLIAR